MLCCGKNRKFGSLNKFRGFFFISKVLIQNSNKQPCLKNLFQRKGSQSLRWTFLIIGNSSEPQYVPLLGSQNNDYDHNCEINLYNKNEHHDDIEDLDNDYHINDQKLELFKDHNKDNCDSQEYYHDHGHNIEYNENNDHGQ